MHMPVPEMNLKASTMGKKDGSGSTEEGSKKRNVP